MKDYLPKEVFRKGKRVVERARNRKNIENIDSEQLEGTTEGEQNSENCGEICSKQPKSEDENIKATTSNINDENIEKKSQKSYVKVVLDKNGEPTSTIKFKYMRSRFCHFVTFSTLTIVAAVFFYFLMTSSGTYLSAWYFSIALAVFLLYLISFPTCIKLKDDILEIDGILELTPIPYKNIKRIYKIDRYRLRRTYPLLGSYGFGGYFGYYFDFAQMKIVYLHATNLSNLVVIEDIYRNKHVISCQESDIFIKEVRQRKIKEPLEV
ncbi:MAG: PH domain-containing protein [Rikenellaceae bacterium]